MPQRTNDFQELVALIRRAFAREGDTVEESAMVKVQGMETEREIDILHKTSDGWGVVKISVEAKDEGRPVDLETVEQLSGKYRGEGRVHVDKCILVARNGFTKGAREKAALLDIPLLTLDEARAFDWTSLGPAYANMAKAQTLKFHVAPHFHEILVEPAVPKRILPELIKSGRVRCRSCPEGRDHGSVLEFVTHWVFGGHDPRMVEKLRELQEFARKSPEGATGNLKGQWVEGNFWIRFDGRDYPMYGLEVNVHSIDTEVPVTCTAYEMTQPDGSTTIIPHLSANIGSRRLNWVMPQGLGSKTIAMSFKSPKERAEARKKNKRRKNAAKKNPPNEN
jgi:hypothetical protein